MLVQGASQPQGQFSPTPCNTNQNPIPTSSMFPGNSSAPTISTPANNQPAKRPREDEYSLYTWTDSNGEQHRALMNCYGESAPINFPTVMSKMTGETQPKGAKLSPTQWAHLAAPFKNEIIAMGGASVVYPLGPGRRMRLCSLNALFETFEEDGFGSGQWKGCQLAKIPLPRPSGDPVPDPSTTWITNAYELKRDQK